MTISIIFAVFFLTLSVGFLGWLAGSHRRVRRAREAERQLRFDREAIARLESEGGRILPARSARGLAVRV